MKLPFPKGFSRWKSMKRWRDLPASSGQRAATPRPPGIRALPRQAAWRAGPGPGETAAAA